MGPALMDDRWIYGSDPANIFKRSFKAGRTGCLPLGARSRGIKSGNSSLMFVRCPAC